MKNPRLLLPFIMALALCMINTNKIWAQNHKIDSLTNANKAYIIKDDKKARILFQLSASLVYTNPKVALTYTDDILSFQNKIKNKAIITSTYRLKGIMQYLLSMYPEALTSLNTALRTDRSLKIKFGEASDLANIGMVHMTQSHFPEALNYYLQSSKIFETLKEHEYDAITVYANTGIIYLEINNYEKALEHFNKAIVNSKRLKNANTEASSLANIGVVYNKQKNYEKAITYSKMSLKLSDSIGDKTGFARETGNLAAYYSSLGKYDLALQYGLKAIDLNKVISNKKSIGYNLQNVAEAYRKKGNYNQAKFYGLSALKTGQDLKIPEMQKGASEGLSKVYEQISMPDSALIYFKQFTLFNDSISNDKKRQEVTRMGIQYDFDKKETIYKQQQLLADEKLKQQQLQLALNNAELQKGIQLRNLQQTQLENEKLQTREKQKQLIISIKNEKLQAGKVKELAQQQKLNKLELKQLWLYGILSLVVLISLVIFLLSLYRIRQLRYKNVLQLQQTKELTYLHKLSESELKAIRSQMNPHFIFNVLNSIEAYIMENDKTTARRLIQKFASLSRLILENSTQSLVVADKEWKALNLYTELQAMRYDQAFTYNFLVAENIKLSALLLPPMLIQPLIENAIQHGLIAENVANGMLEISIEQTGHLIKITVKDNGVGLHHTSTANKLPGIKEKSMGISSIKERIEIINQQFGIKTASFNLSTGKNNKGTIAFITLPILKAKHADMAI